MGVFTLFVEVAVANRKTTTTYSRMSELEDGNENENLTIGANQTRGRGTNGNRSDSFAIDKKGYGRCIESRIPAIDKQTLTE